jgi:hypothetical protein
MTRKMEGGKSGFVKGTVRLKLDRPKSGTIVHYEVVTSNAVFFF